MYFRQTYEQVMHKFVHIERVEHRVEIELSVEYQ